MLISDRYKFIFIAIPKTGTHSVRKIFRDFADDEHVGTGGGVSKRRKSQFEKIKYIHHGHLTATMIRKLVGEEKWNTYLKFAVIRNPYDRFISAYAFTTRNRTHKHKLPINFAKQMKKRGSVPRDDHSGFMRRPQTDFIYDKKGNLLIDFIVRFEHYQQDINKLCEKLNIPPETLPKINPSKHHHYIHYYRKQPQLVDVVKDIYAEDFKHLPYCNRLSNEHEENHHDSKPRET